MHSMHLTSSFADNWMSLGRADAVSVWQLCERWEVTRWTQECYCAYGAGTQVESFAVQPGMVRTDLWNQDKTDVKGKWAAFITGRASAESAADGSTATHESIMSPGPCRTWGQAEA